MEEIKVVTQNEKDVKDEKDTKVNMDAVTERVKSHYIAKGYKDPIENMQIYVKPEDFTAYYVINDGVVGKVNLF